jgi:PAS domain S-box-containing protein
MARQGAEVSLSKLQASEERYRVLAENVPQLVWITRTDGFVEYCNQRWLDYTGLTLDETLGWDWQQAIHPDDLPTTLEKWTTSLSTGNRMEVQYRLKQADGIYRWHITRAVPLHDQNGKIINWFGSCTDIHDQKQAEEELCRSQEQLEFLANASRLLATSLDYETTLASVTNLAVSYLADVCVVDLVEENQLPRRVAVAHIDPSKEKLLHELIRRYPTLLNESSPLQKALHSGQSILLSEIPESLLVDYAQNAEHLKLIKEIGCFCSLMIIPLIAHGRRLGAISFSTTESRRRYSEADLPLAEDLAHRIALAVDNAQLYSTSQEAEQALRQSESQFRRVVESNMIGIGIWERNGKIIEANQALLQLVGYTQNDVQAGNLSWEQLTPDEYKPFDEKALSELETVGTCTPFEKEYIHKDGERIPLLVGGARFEDTPDSGVFFVLDLTERKRAEQERLQLLEELESKQRLLEAVLEQMPAGLVVAEPPSGQLVLMNEQVQQILRGSLSDIKGVEDYLLYQVFYPDGQLYTPEEIPLARSLRTGEVVREEEIDIVCGDGTRKTLLVDSAPIRDAEEHIVAGVITFYDITERKRTRERIQLYADVVKNIQVGLVVWQLEDLEDPGSFRLITSNSAANQVTGVNFESLIGTTMAESFPALLETQLIREYVEVVRTGQAKDLGEVHYRDERVVEGMYSLKAFPLPNHCLGLAFENITAAKQVEEALRDALQKLNFHVENTPLAVIERDRNFRITRWSQGAARIFGWQAEEVIGKGLNELEFVFAEDIEAVNHLRTRLITGAEKHNISHNRSYSKDRSVVHCEWYNSALLDESGHLVSVLSLVLDVTERNQAEEALQQSEERFRQLAENLHDVFWMLDFSNHQLLYVSPAYEQLWGRSCESLYANAHDWIDAVYPEDRDRVETAFFGQVLEGGFDEEFRILRPDGSMRWVRDRGVPVKDDSGATYRIAGIAEDITERKLAQQALKNSQERLKLAQKVGQIGAWEWNFQTNEVIWTEELETLYGLAPGSFDGKYETWAKTLHPDDRTRIQQEAWNGLIEGREFNTEFRILWPDGSVHWLTAKAKAFDDDTGKLWRVIGVNMDITKRKQAEVERINLLEREQAARAQAEAANRIKDEFLAVLSHELRSPLNPILGWSKLLQSRKFDEGTTARALEIIERNAKLQIQLIEDLLDVSRILRGKLSLNSCPVDLVSTIEAAMETVRLAASAKSIQVQTVFEPNVGQVAGDSGRLQQVVWNLLSNAVKFTPQGGRVDIRLSVVKGLQVGRLEGWKVDGSRHSRNLQPANLQPVTSYAQIQVSDTGKGISPDFLPYVFDYFRQENSTTTRLFGGLGLGLAIVRHLVELHGGTVWAESPGEGQGATFTVRLPLMVTQQETNKESQQSDNSPDLSGIRVLVVDDEVDMREFLAFMLEDYGAQVTVVASADQVLEALAQVKPDVLLSDIGMPEVDGYMLIRQIRALAPEQGGRIPAIALTAYAGEADQSQALSAGFTKHIAKPVEPTELAKVVANLAISTSGDINLKAY